MLLVNYFLNLSIKKKLSVFSTFYILLILAFIAVGSVFWKSIDRSYLLKEKVYQLVRFAQNARILEKSYLQYYEVQYYEKVLLACDDILSSIDSLMKQKIRVEKINEIREDIDLYKRECKNINQSYQERLGLYAAINQYEEEARTCINSFWKFYSAYKEGLRAVGRTLPIGEETSSIDIENCYKLLLRLKIYFQQFILEGKREHLIAFKEILNGEYNTILESISKASKTVTDPQIVAFINKMTSILDQCTRIPAPLDESFEIAKASIESLDKIGSKISLNADTLLAEADQANKDAIKSAAVFIFGLSLIGISLALGFGALLNNLITGAVQALMAFAKDLSEGDLTTRIKVTTKDELGKMSATFNQVIDRFQKIIKDVDVNTRTLNNSSENLSMTSDKMSTSANKMKKQAAKVAAAGEALSSNIIFMASSAEKISTSAINVTNSISQISLSINDVAKSCTKESEIAKHADLKAQEASEMMMRLGKTAQETEKIVELITHIADQTNLLALNANIEAASAGGAGTGFSIVANEVKTLSKKSSESAIQVNKLIEQIQKDTKTANEVIKSVKEIIGEVSVISQSIAVVVEEQSSTTNEIARAMQNSSTATNELAGSIHEAARRATEVSNNVQGVSLDADQVALGTNANNTGSQELAQMAIRLQKIVQQFKV
ncbi:MAG: hypothetical protein A2007_00140 [Verrucomicrobia bacterium GWC2_42_7]|nr:MAG: hypothetical protein A2007_00140 [Verrucomicrobia bacterium GWC2_42_7]